MLIRKSFVLGSKSMNLYGSQLLFRGMKSRCFSSKYTLHELTMPSLSPTMEFGNLTRWRKKEGEELHPGEILCEVETDKATVDYEIQDDAVLAKTIVLSGTENIPIGTILGYTVEDLDQYKEFVQGGSLLPENRSTMASSTTTSSLDNNAKDINLKKENVSSQSSQTGKYSGRTPLIRFLGKRSLLSSRSTLETTTRSTLEENANSKTTYQQNDNLKIENTMDSSNEEYTDIPLSNMRKVIAKRLASSKATVPHNYTSIDCEIDNLLQVRKQLKAKHQINVSMNDFILKAVALALRDVPAANCSWNASKHISEKNSVVDISVAVATDSGLITPIVMQVDTKGLVSINKEFKDLVTRARANKLKPEEFQGGSFTVSNLGGFGINNFTAVINPPQGCILAVGGGRKVIVPKKENNFDHPSDHPDEKDELQVATLMNVTLSSDRRVVDEVVAAQFLQVFKTYIDNPELLVL